jgi:hypothetical protein
MTRFSVKLMFLATLKENVSHEWLDRIEINHDMRIGDGRAASVSKDKLINPTTIIN